MRGIYQIVRKNKVYIGSAEDFSKRWAEHRLMLQSGRHHNRHLQHAWTKFGAEEFHFSIIEEIPEYDKEVFYSRENFWMDAKVAEGFELYNHCRTGSGWSNQTLDNKASIADKISNSLKTFASTLTVEQRKEKWGKGKQGKPLSDEHKRKTSIGLKGKQKSDETRKRMSEAQRALKAEEQIERQSRMSELGKLRRGKTPSNACVYIIDGVTYPSGAQAMRVTGLTSRQLVNMVKNGNARKEKKEF